MLDEASFLAVDTFSNNFGTVPLDPRECERAFNARTPCSCSPLAIPGGMRRVARWQDETVPRLSATDQGDTRSSVKSLQLGESCSAFQRYCQTLAMGSNPSCDTSPRDHSCTAVPEPRHSCPCTARSRLTRFQSGLMTSLILLKAAREQKKSELSTFDLCTSSPHLRRRPAADKGARHPKLACARDGGMRLGGQGVRGLG